MSRNAIRVALDIKAHAKQRSEVSMALRKGQVVRVGLRIASSVARAIQMFQNVIILLQTQRSINLLSLKRPKCYNYISNAGKTLASKGSPSSTSHALIPPTRPACRVVHQAKVYNKNDLISVLALCSCVDVVLQIKEEMLVV